MKKTSLLGAFLLVCALFTLVSTINLNAAVTASFVSSPGDSLAPRNARIEFLTFAVTSDTTEPITDIVISTTDSLAGKVRRVAILNAQGDEIGSAEPGEQRLFGVSLRDTVNKANWSSYFTVVSETAYDLGEFVGQTVRLSVEGVGTRDGANSTLSKGNFPFWGAKYVLNNSLTVGQLFQPQRLYKQANAVVGNNQIIGAFKIPIWNVENISVSSLPFVIHANGNVQAITAVTLLNRDGKVLAGPVDCRYIPEWGKGMFRFYDRVTLSSGDEEVYFRANIGRDFANGATIAVATNPAEWTGVKGTKYGYGISLADLALVTGPTINVKGPRLDLSVQAPAFITAVAGSQKVTSLTVTLDATESSEDMRIQWLPLTVATLVQYWANHIQFAPYDANTGEDMVNGTTYGLGSDRKNDGTVFQLPLPLSEKDSGLIVQKGTKRQIAVKVNLQLGPAFYAVGLTDLYNMQAIGTSTGISVSPNWSQGWTIIQVLPNPNGGGRG